MTTRLLTSPPVSGATRQSVTVAVLGTGSAGMRHLRALARLPHLQALVVPVRPARMDALKVAGYDGLPDLATAASQGATACIIATETGRHAEDALGALEQGLDLLVEKPLAVDGWEARQVTARAQATRRVVCVGCVLRFSDSLASFRAFLPQVGRLHAVRIECQSYLPDWRPQRPYRDSYSARRHEGGVLRDLIHEIDYAGWLFGWPTAVQADVRNLGRLGIEAEEAAELMWQVSTGCAVSLSLDYLTRPTRRWMKACGEAGMVEWDGVRGTVTLATGGAPVKEVTSSQTRDEMLMAQARAFIEATRGIRDERLATSEDGVKALAVCDAARRASASRREEPVDYL